jgi:hypothetical protein
MCLAHCWYCSQKIEYGLNTILYIAVTVNVCAGLQLDYNFESSVWLQLVGRLYAGT